MSANMVVIIVDECGEEREWNRFTVGSDLDEDYIDLWKYSKIEQAWEEYPEARNIYVEDRRNWNSMIYASMRGDEYYDPWEDEEVPV